MQQACCVLPLTMCCAPGRPTRRSAISGTMGPELIKPVAELEPTLLSPIWSAQARE